MLITASVVWPPEHSPTLVCQIPIAKGLTNVCGFPETGFMCESRVLIRQFATTQILGGK
ncbi:hypothetical protein CO2235_MP130114 [Cupriavidus oxalaticus]|uniref:Uncharacterized protein n=1 Tax=Cupriavidus oxalaticus TaxID=96344 RepID=A0A976BH62_9BURK|nr:hypothetical protein CO2235_MP130114 [Cupriavidus oxalaticus]